MNSISTSSKYLFWISIFVFLIGISYSGGYMNGSSNALSGSAGVGEEAIPNSMSTELDWITLVGGVGAAIGGFGQILSPIIDGWMKRRNALIERENQLREIEILKIENHTGDKKHTKKTPSKPSKKK